MPEKNEKWSAGGIAFVGCLFLGIALGMYFKQTAIGTMMGLGVGFLIMALLRYKK